jgi:general secretion pathway protein K
MGPMKVTRQRGIALVAVLWALVLLAVIAATVLRESRTQSRLARNFVDSAAAEALADGGVHRALAGLAAPISGGGWRVDGTVYSWRPGRGEVLIRIEDEGGKFSLNRVSAAQLQKLFATVGLAPETAEALADRVLDYRDRDDTRRPAGAEDSDYAAAGLPHGAKDGPYEALEELHQVLGMTREIYEAVAPALSAHSNGRRPDRKVAPPLVAAILQGGGAPPPQPVPFSGTLSGGNRGPEASPPGIEGTDDPSVKVVFLGPTPHRSRVRVYTIHTEAKTEAGGVFVRRAVVRLMPRGDLPYRILEWGRGKSQLLPAPAFWSFKELLVPGGSGRDCPVIKTWK